MNHKLKKSLSGVWTSSRNFLTLDQTDANTLLQEARKLERKRARICCHKAPSDVVHEMLIAVDRKSYVRPHKHIGKPESLLALKGKAEVVFFNENGGISRVVPLGALGTGRNFYYRVATPEFHTLIIQSPVFIFMEVTQGPWESDRTVYAPWSPEEHDIDRVKFFKSNILMKIKSVQQS